MIQNRNRRAHHQPALERLEVRLPPGDALLGLLLAWPQVPQERCELEQELVAAVDFDECETPALVSSRPRAQAEEHPSTAGLSLPTDESTDQRAAALIAVVYTAGINPAARSAGVFNAEEITNSISFAAPSFARFAGGAMATPLPALRAQWDASPPREQGEPAGDQSHVMDNYGKLPMSFEANQGQADSRVDFIARAGAYTAFLTPTAAVFSIENSESRIQNSELLDRASRGALAPGSSPSTRTLTRHGSPGVALYMDIVGANPDARATGADHQPGIVNYFIGNDPSQWHSNISTFGRVEYDDVYPGIDVVYYGKDQQLEYDFVVSPGADPNQIALNFAGGDGAEIDDGGNLVLHTAAGDFVQQKPYLYQEVDGVRQEVAGSFVLSTQYSVLSTQHSALVTFNVGAYDATRPLVIDPLVLGYSTFLGGSGMEWVGGIAVDADGNAYVTGRANSSDFPTTPGAFDTTYNGNDDAFVAKLNASGTALVYSTFLGGTNQEFWWDIAVDAGGNAFVTGYTKSSDFPTTPGAFATSYGGGDGDAFVTKLNATGSALVYSTFLGGTKYETGYGIAVDAAGSAYVTGTTLSIDFPTTPGAFDTSYNGNLSWGDAFVTKLRPDGAGLLYSTFLGGGTFGDDIGFDIAVDLDGNAYVTGETQSSNFPTTPGAFDTTFNATEAFVAKLNAAGSALIYSTFLGGCCGETGYGIAVDTSGSAYVAGLTGSSDFPVTPGAFDTSFNGDVDAFVTKLRADGTGLIYATFLGGDNTDHALAIALDSTGHAYVTGSTRSAYFPVTPDAVKKRNRGTYDTFVTKFNASGTALDYSTYLGVGGSDDSGHGIDLDASGNVYLMGATASAKFPTTPGAFDTSFNGGSDAFVTKFAEV